MNLGKLKLAVPASLLAVALLAAACSETGETQNESEGADLNGATSAEVFLRMGAGDLDLTGGSDRMLDAGFTYNVEDWDPQVDWDVSNGHGRLEIDQSGSGSVSLFDLDDIENEWDLSLNDDIPMTLDVELGAGDGTLNLGSLTLTRLDVQTGAGETTIDLTGDWANDLDATVEAGVGRVKLLLPADVGVRVETDTGIVDMDHDGLTKDGDVYTNDAFGVSDATLTINVDAGVGQVELEVVQ
ncbi:MAG TPA: toast rack family protein [Thermomicrobiales bacterium]|nr:toast rack family protein [Thermomicrobiales bacterium]